MLSYAFPSVLFRYYKTHLKHSSVCCSRGRSCLFNISLPSLSSYTRSLFLAEYFMHLNAVTLRYLSLVCYTQTYHSSKIIQTINYFRRLSLNYKSEGHFHKFKERYIKVKLERNWLIYVPSK